MSKYQSFFTKYELLLFLMLTYLLSWWTVPLMNGQLFPYGPAFAAVIVLGITAGRQGLGELWRRVTQWRIPFVWFIAGPAILVGYQAVGFVVNLLVGAQVASPPYISWGTFLELLLVGGLWEEPGWSGYLLPKMQARFGNRPNGLLIAALVTGSFRTIWHLPLFLYGNTPWFSFFIFIFATQLIVAWVFYGSGGSVLAVMLLHFVDNLTGSGFMSQVFTGAEWRSYYAIFTTLASLVALAIVWKSRFRFEGGHETQPA